MRLEILVNYKINKAQHLNTGKAIKVLQNLWDVVGR